VAEIQLNDQELLRFDIPKATTIIVHHKDKSKAIDPWGKYSIDDIKFDLESID
jgi:hypothetical protein